MIVVDVWFMVFVCSFCVVMYSMFTCICSFGVMTLKVESALQAAGEVEESHLRSLLC